MTVIVYFVYFSTSLVNDEHIRINGKSIHGWTFTKCGERLEYGAVNS